MHVVVGGASGFLGTALVPHLREQGHQVTRLVRKDDASADASLWEPGTGRIDQVVIDRADVVVNLSGSPIIHWPPTGKYRRELLASRVDTTTTLARAVAASPSPPALISASGMSYYGSDRGKEVLTESSDAGTGSVLCEVVHRWENATSAASEAGARVCRIRTTAAMHRSGSLLGTALPVFRLGLGARIGSGKQYMSMLSRTDWIRAATFLIEHDDLSGPFNLGMPNPVTNAEFTDALGKALHRPTRLVAPAPVLRLAAGSLADDLLGSLRVVPAALLEAGFTFEHPDIDSMLQAAIH
jgi:uncharacterized protein (TIGR01777 family)